MTYRRTDTDPETVERLTFVLFAEDGMAYGYADGRPELPCGQVRDGEDWLLDATERIPLMTAGFFRQRVHLVAVDGTHLYVFAEGVPYRGRREHIPVELTKLSAEDLAERLDGLLANVVRDAADSFRTQTEDSYHADNLRLIEPAYLRGNTAEAGSGSAGTAERGLHIEPYGVDKGPRLVELARRRLPQWADRIEVGNALTWRPTDGRRFDYVHLLLDYAPTIKRTALLQHALDHLVARRLLVSHYISPPEPTARDLVAELGFPIAGASGQTVWIDP